MLLLFRNHIYGPVTNPPVVVAIEMVAVHVTDVEMIAVLEDGV